MLYDVWISYLDDKGRTRLYNRRVDFKGSIKEATKWATRQETACYIEHPKAEVYINITAMKP